MSGYRPADEGERIVKLDKLVKTLRRDLAANPMKAGVLGVLLLGGLYFWGPLIWKWVGKKGTPAAAAAAPAQEHASEQSAAVPTVTEEVKLQESPLEWQEIKKQREADSLTRSADYQSQWDQIFQVAAVTSVAQLPEEMESSNQEQLDPKDLGLVLQGVFIGSRSKKAIINGTVYCERDSIPVDLPADESGSDNTQQEVEFRLVRVFRRMVELERAGKTWQLQLATPESLKRNLERSAPEAPFNSEPRDESTILSGEN